MVINLSKYNDLGRCSYASLKEVFDTKKDEIYDNGKKVNITCVEDLFPYLWQSPGVAIHSNGRSSAYFHGAGTHWHNDYDESIRKHDDEIERLKKKVDKSTIDKKKARYKAELDDLVTHNGRLKDMVNRLDNEMLEQMRLLKEDNR